MKKDQLRKLLPEEIDQSVVDAIMDAIHAEMEVHRRATEEAQKDAEAAKSDLATKMKELENASVGAKSIEELQKSLDDLQKKYDTDTKAAAEELELVQFEGLLDSVIREAKGRNAKAVRALLDIDTLKASKNQQADAEAAVKALAEKEDTAFLFGTPDAEPTGKVFDVGGKAGGIAEVNPWAKDTWNMTAQAQIFRAEPEKAKALAKAAGVQIL